MNPLKSSFWYIFPFNFLSLELSFLALLNVAFPFDYLLIQVNGLLLFKSINLQQSPSTSHIEAGRFVVNDHTAQLCLRIVQWLEGLASKALDLESKVISFIYC